MIRATLDANVVASGVIGIERAESTPGAIMRLWHRRAFEFITSDPLVAEIERTLLNAYFASRISARQRDLTIISLKRDATWTEITVVVAGVATHPEDDVILAVALSASTDYLVTGDRKLQKLKSYQGVLIVSPRDFLTLLERQGAGNV